MSYTKRTSNYTANPYDFVVMDSTSARTVTFPANADLVGGEEIAVLRQNTGTVTVTAGASSTIEGAETEAIPARYDAFRYIYNKQGTRWERQSVAVGERWAGVYTGSTANNVDFPVGTNLIVYSASTGGIRNASVTVRLSTENSLAYITYGEGSTLTGTWRWSGQTAWNASSYFGVARRVS